jgi:hypothetical protein
VLEKELMATLAELNWKHAVLAASHEDQKNIALTTILALLAERKELRFSCKARAGNTGSLDPQDCDWPFCGCDEYASKVLETVEESGYATPREVTQMRVDALEVTKALESYVASFDAHRTETDAMLDALCHALTLNSNCCEYIGRVHDAHRTKLREIMDCAREGKFSPADWKRLVEAAG